MVSASAIAGGVEPQPCIFRSHGEMLVRLRLIGSTRRQPARAGFKTLVMLGVAALRLRKRERHSGIASSGRGTDQGGFDAVAAGKIEMDEPGFRARCAPRIRSGGALSAEPISVFHGSHLVCKREHTVSLCHGTLAGRSGDVSGVAPKDWINQRDDTGGTGCPSAVGPAPAQLRELVGLLVRCTEHDERHSRRRRAAYPGDWKLRRRQGWRLRGQARIRLGRRSPSIELTRQLIAPRVDALAALGGVAQLTARTLWF
jgi:hypothetical protein